MNDGEERLAWHTTEKCFCMTGRSQSLIIPTKSWHTNTGHQTGICFGMGGQMLKTHKTAFLLPITISLEHLTEDTFIAGLVDYLKTLVLIFSLERHLWILCLSRVVGQRLTSGHRRNSATYTWFQLSYVWSHFYPRITNYILSTRSLSLLFRNAVIRPLLNKSSLEPNSLKNIIQFPFLYK